GGVERALAAIEAPTLVVGIDSDQLFPLAGQHRIAAGVANSFSGDRAVEIHSPYGHDGFLLELHHVGDALRALFART
ncbi:MAG: homoserine O-acetyltransferase MetX, partial [Pseudoclavibacter sp.]